MEQLLEILNRLSALLDQYDSSEQSVAQVEMQNEMLNRMGSEHDKEITPAKAQATKSLRIIKASKESCERAITGLTTLNPETLRDRIIEIKLAMDRAGDLALEEKRYRQAFEILAETDGFGEDPGETRADFEEKLSALKRSKEVAIKKLQEFVYNSINRTPIAKATDSVLSLLQS